MASILSLISESSICIFLQQNIRITVAVTASTTGTALTAMQGSWRPFMAIVVSVMVGRWTVLCSLPIDGVGLKQLSAQWASRGDTAQYPAAVVGLCHNTPVRMTKGSLFSEPRSFDDSKPAPNSSPLTAGIPNSASASLFSIPSNMGEPEPAGSPVTAHSTVPPTESSSAAAFLISSAIFSPFASSITGSFRDAIRSKSSFAGSRGKLASETGPTDFRWAPT